MKLLLLNANTTAAMTERMVAIARRLAGPAVAVGGATGRFGASYISTRAAAAIAGHAALDLLAEHVGRDNPQGHDAVLLACFGDPGLLALKELSPVPVLGMAEASLGLAAQLGTRIGLITGGSRWVAMLREFATLMGHGDRVVAIRATPLTGAEIAADPAGAAARLRDLAQRCIDEDHTDVIVFGGAGLVGLAETLQPQLPVPLLDSLTCLVQAGLSAARLGAAKPGAGSFAPPPRTPSIGLSAALDAAL
ncbi:MAG: aspartate/glutamate racemase family protein [Alphaproteobacteria bacterium]|nr:aspartate/glutamate racemase family protein [Alphaproteobacteria bacterium]